MPASDDSASDESLRSQLEIAREAAATAERERGVALGELAQTSEELAAAVAAQADWERLRAEAAEELRQTRDRLAAIETSRTWRFTQLGLAPYRLIRERVGR